MNVTAVRLSMRRLGASLGTRLGWVGAVVVALVFATGTAGGDDVVLAAVRASCWLAAGPLALAAAHAPARRDRVDGIDVLVGTRGIDVMALRRSRLVAAAVYAAALVGVPTLLVALTALVVAPSGGMALRGGLAVAGALVAGAIIGLLGAACGELGRERGRSLLVAAVVLPWMLADVWSVPSLSLVGALDAGLSWMGEVDITWW